MATLFQAATPVDTVEGQIIGSTPQTSTDVSPPPVPAVLSKQEISLSSQLLLFSFAVIILECVIIKITNMDSTGAIRLITVTLILTCTIFLFTAGYGSQQIATATGLLGTIAGYLLGRTTPSSSSNTGDK